MKGENGTPETPEWQPEPKPWNESRCCTGCAGICETDQQHAWLIGDNVELGDN